MKRLAFYLTSILALLAVGCNQLEDGLDLDVDLETKKQKMDFDIMVTRGGQVISKERVGVMTRGDVDTGDKLATMDEGIPFGLVGIDFEHNRLLIDNANVSSTGGSYSTFFDGFANCASQDDASSGQVSEALPRRRSPYPCPPFAYILAVELTPARRSALSRTTVVSIWQKSSSDCAMNAGGVSESTG